LSKKNEKGTSILVAVDFFPCSKSAVAQAAWLAHATDATLHVFHAIDPLVVTNLANTMPIPVEELGKQVADDAKKSLDEIVGQIPVVRPEKVEIQTVVGSPVEEILKKAQAVSANFLILGMYGGFGSGRGAGSVAAKCMQKATTNVVLVHESQRTPFRTVVVCVDFSESSRAAVAHGVRIAAIARSQLHLLHVFNGPWHRLHYRAPTREANPDFQQQYLSALQTRMKALLEPFASELDALEIHCEIRDHMNDRRGIVEYATKTGADLLILGSTGRMPLYSLLVGNTAAGLLRKVPRSMLIVRREMVARNRADGAGQAGLLASGS